MDKLTKQAHLLHSLLFEKKHIHEQIAKSISENFAVPIDEAINKCSMIITGLSVHLLHLMIIKKMKDGKILAQKFLVNIGKSDSDIKEIHETFGGLEIDNQNKFKEMLENYLGIPANADLSDYYYMRVKFACESIIEMVDKQTDKIEMKDGTWDYADSTTQENFIDEVEAVKNKDNPTISMSKGHIVIKLKCPHCGTEGENTCGSIIFRILGKDREGFLYFECPDCKEHLQYNPVTGEIRTRKGLLGFLFGRFSQE
jgi:hypothetical protein